MYDTGPAGIVIICDALLKEIAENIKKQRRDVLERRHAY